MAYRENMKKNRVPARSGPNSFAIMRLRGTRHLFRIVPFWLKSMKNGISARFFYEKWKTPRDARAHAGPMVFFGRY